MEFSLLPDDLRSQCLARFPIRQFKTASLVSKAMSRDVSSDRVFDDRTANRLEGEILYVCLKIGEEGMWYSLGEKPNNTGKLLMQVSPKVRSSLPVSCKLSNSIKLSREQEPLKPPSNPMVAVNSKIFFKGADAESRKLNVINCRDHSCGQTASTNLNLKSSTTSLLQIKGDLYLLDGDQPMKLDKYSRVHDKWESIVIPPVFPPGFRHTLVAAGSSDDEILQLWCSKRQLGRYGVEEPGIKLSLNLRNMSFTTEPKGGFKAGDNQTILLIGDMKIRIVFSWIDFWHENQWVSVKGFKKLKRSPDFVVGGKKSLICVWKENKYWELKSL